MFDSLQDGLSNALRTLTGKARLTEANMREGLKAVEDALLDADVSFPVVKDFIGRVAEQATGERVLKTIDPTQQVVSIVFQELVNLMGPVDHSLHLKPEGSVLMLCGLQGSGKTTTCAKLARMIQKRGRKPMLVAADLQRPAAIEQLHVLGQQLGIPVYSEPGATDPVRVCQTAVRKAKEHDANVIILDTAGRLHIDEELMGQLTRIDERVEPDQVLLVVDGMTGQDAVNIAKAFNEALELDGVIMTKLDGDARGGAALSVKAITGVPLKFIGVGEQIDALEEFHPDRMAQRILGMGDIVSLVQQAQDKLDQDALRRQEEELRKGQFTLENFREMLQQTTRMGPMKKVMGLIPGMGSLVNQMGDIDADKDVRRMMGMIDSMTPAERRNPDLIDHSRRRRIAAGSGTEPHEINNLVKQFDHMAKIMKDMANMSMLGRLKAVRELGKQGAMNPGGMISAPKRGTGKRLTSEERKKAQKLREKEQRRKKRDERRGHNGSP